jgi:hypothetical protein
VDGKAESEHGKDDADDPGRHLSTH